MTPLVPASQSWVDASTLDEVLDAVSCVILVTEVDTGVVAYMNKAAETVMGYSRAEVLGLPIWDTMVVPVGLPAVASIVSELGGTITCDSELHRGSCFTVQLPLPSREG